MNLDWYVDGQLELNSVLPNKPSDEQLIAAIVAELGEFANSVKYGESGWVWWPRPDAKVESRDEALGELIDILHFLLVGYARKNLNGLVYHQSMLDEFIDSPAEPRAVLYDLPFEILKNARQDRFHLAILAWLAMAKAYGFSEREIEDGFDASIHKNLSRWVP